MNARYTSFVFHRPKYEMYLTFDCDPLLFDDSLTPLKNDGFAHLSESIPITLGLLEKAFELTGKSLRATFFIRNISTSKTGNVEAEPWETFSDLWEEITFRGHGLGLHPHINVPLASMSERNFLEASRLIRDDFEKLRRLRESARITRVGGHAYNSYTVKLLKLNRVDVDSSAIPGRKLGNFTDASDWRNTRNGLYKNWAYEIGATEQEFNHAKLTQIPMTTLASCSKPGNHRYLDFSFSTFEDYRLPKSSLSMSTSHLVAITHPASLLEDRFLKHKTLVFGEEHWLNNFMNFFNTLGGPKGNIRFNLLRNLP